MEEVDSIILHFLRKLNINIGTEIKNICDLSVETIIESVSKCLITINSNLKVPPKLPSGISQKIEVGAQIASICKDLGYKNDVGYQTFLYYNEAELRSVFMFLIERLPNESKQNNTNSAPMDKKSLLMKIISDKIGEELNAVWIPPCCNLSNKKKIGDFIYPPVNMPKKNLDGEELIQKLVKIQESNIIIIPQLSSKEQETSTNKTDIEIERKQEINKSLKELKEIAIMLRQKLDALESERNVMNVEYSEAQKSCARVESDLKNVYNILNNIGITNFEFEDIIGDNISERVQKNIDMLHKKSEDLTSRNLTLKMEIERKRNSMNLLESERNHCKRILINLKESAKAMNEEYEKKEEVVNQLKKNYEKLKGGNKRSVYTKRILEIISNVDKQNMEIKKILEDTRQLQKEINTLEGQLDRCFSIADETLFRDAKKDDQARKAYKLLALLHSECNTIVSLVNDTGTLARDIVDLEDNIKAEKAKRTEDSLKKILVDLAQMQEESEGVYN